MAEFDPVVWKQKAWAGFCHSASPDHNPSPEKESRWIEDINAINDIAKIIKWCLSRCITVSFTKRFAGIYDDEIKSIEIASNANRLKQLIYLLHECGHYLVSEAHDTDRFPHVMTSDVDAEKLSKTFHYKVSSLEEEFEAWHRGWRLARRLKLKLTRKQFDKVRLECLKSYIHWSTRKGKL